MPEFICANPAGASKHFFTVSIVGQIALGIFVGAGRANAQSQADESVTIGGKLQE